MKSGLGTLLVAGLMRRDQISYIKSPTAGGDPDSEGI
jgi:hypothetical protein